MHFANLHVIDVSIIVLFMIGTVGVGFRLGRRTDGLEGYLLGGRNLPWYLLLGSIVATETSTVTFLSAPGTSFAAGGDFRFLQLVIGFVIGRLLVTALLLPQFFAGKPFTAYQVLNERFGPSTSSLASILFIATRTLSDGIRLYLTAIVLEKALGISLPVSVMVIGTATILYTLVGGMKSVVWNDCIQLVIYLTGAVIAAWLLVDELSWKEITAYARDNEKLGWLDLKFDMTAPLTLWGGVLGGSFVTLATHGTDQMMVQRYLCARSKAHAGWALALSGPLVFLQFALFLCLGVALACFYAQPENSGLRFSRNDEVFATYIANQMPVGICGLVIAAVFSAAMSTLSSSLNSTATAVVNDFQKARRPTPIATQDQSANSKSDKKLTFASRVWTIVFGVLQIMVAAGADQMFRVSDDPTAISSAGKSVITGVLSIAGFSSGIVLGVFFLGVLTKYRNDAITRDAIAFGLILMTWITLASDLAWTWYALIGSMATLSIGVLFHWLARVDRVKVPVDHESSLRESKI